MPATRTGARLRLLAAGVMTAWTLVVVGCGGPAVGRVSGQVKRASGEPLADANLIARNDETGKSCYATTGPDGSFELSSGEPGAGVPPGNYSVVVMENKPNRDSVVAPTIAAKYSDPSESGLTFTVTAGESKTFDVSVDPP